MLVIFTNYDQVSAVLKDCALQLVRKGNGRRTVKLGPPHSDSKGVQKTLMASQSVTLFYFGHGELPPRGLVAQDMKPGIHSKNLDLLKNRLVCATSCYSAQSLAAASKRHGATVIGYRGEMMVSFRDNDRKLQKRCILAAAMSLLAGNDAATAIKAAINAFSDAADKLIKGNVEDSTIASAVYQINAQALELSGPNRKMR
jgi:hypothetical protein